MWGMIPCHIWFVLLLRTDASLIFRILHLIYQTHTLFFLWAMPANTCFQISILGIAVIMTWGDTLPLPPPLCLGDNVFGGLFWLASLQRTRNCSQLCKLTSLRPSGRLKTGTGRIKCLWAFKIAIENVKDAHCF